MTFYNYLNFLKGSIIIALCWGMISLAYAQKKDQKPTPVIVMSAYKDKFVDKVEAIGTLRANESITLSSTVTEIATAINFTDGQRVKKGDILVEMTNEEEKSLLDQQRALVNEASQKMNRALELVPSGASSKALLDERQNDYTSAKAALAALQSRLDDHIITAPFDGVVGLRNISAGTLLQPGTIITTLDDDSIMKIDFSVPSVFISSLVTGMKIKAKSSGFADTFEGEVSAIDSQIDEITRSIAVRAILPNPERKLKPGLLMTVELQKDARENVCIPESGIVPEGKKHFVYTVNEENNSFLVQKREVIIGTRKEGFVEIKSGLQEGERFVTQGTMMVRDGAKIKITAEQKKGESLDDVLKRVSAENSKGQKQDEDGK
jgi:membrane fusion protein (multidrug efflux system)